MIDTDVPESVIEDALYKYCEWLADGETVPHVSTLYESAYALDRLLNATNVGNVPFDDIEKLRSLNKLLLNLHKDVEKNIQCELESLNDTE